MSNAPIPLSRLRRHPEASSSFLTEDGANTPEDDDIADLFPHSLALDEDTIAAIHPRWKRDLHCLMEQPTSSSSAFFIHVFLTALILISAVITIMETIPSFHYISTSVWFGLETSLVALFTVEYIARVLAWSGTWSSQFGWMFSFFGIIDLLAIFPYYIEIILQQDTSVFFRFSILRMFRLLRVFRPFRNNNTILLTIEVMYLSVRRSQHALLAIGFFVFMVLTVFSTLLYFAERGIWDSNLETFINSNGEPTQFASIPAAAWFVLVTITTVGYGEITPRSFLGRLITLPLLVFGLLLIALPSFVLGREFSIVWEKMSRDTIQEEEVPISPLYRRHHGGQRPPPSATYPKDVPGPLRAGDLSNLKLAQNQTELSRQIADLRALVEGQAALIQRLVEGVDKGKRREE